MMKIDRLQKRAYKFQRTLKSRKSDKYYKKVTRNSTQKSRTNLKGNIENIQEKKDL